MLHEFEVKISRSDFFADKKKGTRWGGKSKFEFYQYEQQKAPNYFHYICPENLIAESEIPAFAGLYYYSEEEGIYLVKSPKRIHHKPQDADIFKKMLRLHTQRKYLGGCMMTFKNRRAKEQFEKYYPTVDKDAEQEINKINIADNLDN